MKSLVMSICKYVRMYESFWKSTREWPWAKQALQAKEQRPWGPESQGPKKKTK